eukprot:1279333-Pleurochrysis_carterae.AAC.1
MSHTPSCPRPGSRARQWRTTRPWRPRSPSLVRRCPRSRTKGRSARPLSTPRTKRSPRAAATRPHR